MRINNLSKIYRGKYDTVKALNDMTLNFDEKGLVFIVGVSGSGKSTLMNMLSGIDKPSNGDVIVGGKSLYDQENGEMFGYRNSYVALIFQDYNLIDDLDVYDNIKLPLELLGQTDFSKVDEVIKAIDIEDIAHHKVTEISSGQMQRVAIARALVKDANIILADEPTGNLDSTNGDIVLNLLKEVSKEKLVVVITHDDYAAHKFGDRIIEIEDGRILSDSRPLAEEDDNTLPEFKQPIVTFKNQVRFTKNFIRRYIARSLTIFITLLLVPIIGAILAGYGFFDVAKTYQAHQKKYGGEYVVLAMEKRGLNVYFDADTYTDTFNAYPGSKLIQVFNTSIVFKPVNETDDDYDSFYTNEIKHVSIYQNGFFKINGSEPTNTDEIVITDYLEASLEHYLGYVPDKLNIYGHNYEIVGVADTDYENFKNADLSDDFTRMAFEDNMYIYNSIIMDEASYGDPTDSKSFVRRCTQYKEIFYCKTINTGETIKDIEITVYSQSAKNVTVMSTSVRDYPKITGKTAYFSTALINQLGFGNNYRGAVSKNAPAMTFYDRSRCVANFQVGGVFESDKCEIILADSTFHTYAVDKVGYGRLVISINDKNYNKIVNNENVINNSFVYASSINDRIKSTRIAIFEVLFAVLVIIVAFGGFINSYTLSNEKRKIGIKYSLGLSRKKIVTPYILEYLLYIIIGFIASFIIAKFGYPLILRVLNMADEFAYREATFFYISAIVIIGWNLTIAVIMIASLLLMIASIMRKSPVEIIKDI